MLSVTYMTRRQGAVSLGDLDWTVCRTNNKKKKGTYTLRVAATPTVVCRACQATLQLRRHDEEKAKSGSTHVAHVRVHLRLLSAPLELCRMF